MDHEQAFKWMAVLGRLGNLYVDQQLKRADINSSHHPFVLHICRSPGITQETLRGRILVHPSNITRALEHLERAGYITREPLPEDKRTCRLYPTPRAQALYPEIVQILDGWGERLTGDMDAMEADAFLQALQKAGQAAAALYFPYQPETGQ